MQTNKYLTLYDYIDSVKKALTILHVDKNDYPTLEEVVLLYVCQLFENIYYNVDHEIFLIDVYIINRFYKKAMKLYLQTANNPEEDEWNKLWELSASKIIKYSTQQELNEITKWFALTDDIILNIIANNRQFDYITKYDKKFTNRLFLKYVNAYVKYYADFNNINTNEEEDI